MLFNTPDSTSRGRLPLQTNGAGIGNTPTILTYASIDLITWSSERVVTLMGPDNFPPPTKITDLWAPEWRFDNASAAYMVSSGVLGSDCLRVYWCFLRCECQLPLNLDLVSAAVLVLLVCYYEGLFMSKDASAPCSSRRPKYFILLCLLSCSSTPLLFIRSHCVI